MLENILAHRGDVDQQVQGPKRPWDKNGFSQPNVGKAVPTTRPPIRQPAESEKGAGKPPVTSS